MVRWIEQPHHNPGIRELMQIAHIEIGIVLFDHLRLVFLAKLGFPAISVYASPTPIRLPHLPIRADHVVTGTEQLLAPKLITEIEWNFFKLVGRRLLKK